MEPPSFSTTGPQVVRAAPGSVANLVLPLPSGSPPFHFEWSRAGAKLDDRFKPTDSAGGVRLTISTVSTGDSGQYTLQASNAAGKDTTRVRLEVSPDEKPTGEDPPTFLRRLQDLTVKVGTRTRFLVEIVSSTECRVTWYRNERRLLEAERIALVRDGNFWCADISAVSVDDAGRWTCTAENVGGRASCSAHLNVLVPKAYKRPEFVEELRALLTEQGTVSLECKVVGVPTPVLRWFKDSREIKAGDVFALTANAEDPTSLGTYTCEAVNCMGRAYSSSKVHVIGRSSREGSARPTSGGHVALEPPPIFTKELEDQFVRICEPLTLSCNIVVPPWPRSIVWYNKEGKIELNEKYRVLEDGVGGYLVEVPSAEWPDEGEWKCVATSSAGRIGITTCYVSMDVPKNYRKPRFMENLQAVLTEEGLVSFECKVVGFPTPVLSWFKDGQELKPGDVYQLTGTNSLGSYCCIARNCMGQASSSAELTVEDIQNQLNEEEKLQLFSKNQAPKFLQGLKSVEAKIDEPFRFTIKVAIPPEPTVLWYRDDQPVDESSRCHLGKEERGVFFIDIQSLEFMDQAEWKCVAMNDFGHSVTSCFLKLIIPRHYKKPRFLENLQAILSDEGAVNLECKVIGVPQPVLKWYKDGEELKPGDIHRIISGQDGTCCLGTYTCEAQNCMGIAASSASLLGFEDSIKTKGRKKEDEQTLQRNLSLSTIHEERTSQMYDTPVGDITLDDKGEISFSFDGKEVSVSLYETPDLTEEEALQIVEMYADQLSENVTEHNVVELPPLRFVKETSTSGNLLMEAIIIDVSPEYFTSPEEDLRTEADVEDISIADENGPPQLSLDQEVDGEDYLEKTMALLSDEKANFPKKTDRKKSDSQKSADDYFSLSRDQSLSDEKKEDDTQALSESDLQSFASAHSSGKVKSKPSIEDGQESSDITKTVLLKEDLQTMRQQNEIDLGIKNKDKRWSQSSRRSSSGSEISLNKMREDVIDGNFANTLVATVLDQEKTTAEINSVNSTLTKLINDVQVIERDIILKSELLPTAATASRSLEIINSVIIPLSEIHSIAEAIKESINESLEITTSLFNRLPQPLNILQQSLTIIEKCIDLQSENKTLVKKTCTNIIEKCAGDMNKLVIDINSIVNKYCPFIENTCVSSIQKTNNEILNTITCSEAAIKEFKEVSEKIDSKLDKITPELKHLQKTQKAVYELRNPLQSLLHIADAVDISGSISLENVTKTQVILNDMSAPIQALQTALEQIEILSVTETQSSFQKYNTEIMETVMDSVIKLRTSFEQLSVEAGKTENVNVLKKVLVDIKHNISEISSHLDEIEAKIGPFDVLQSENKLEALQKMAQILINLENNLVILDIVPCLKMHMAEFHKNLTKVLEHVIESNDATKYLTFLEICEGINRLNCLIKNIDANDILSLAGISNNLKLIQANVKKNEFTSDLNFSLNSNVTDLLVDINETMNHADTSIYSMISENLEDFSIKHYEEAKFKIVLEQIEKAISSISNVVSLETTKDLDIEQAFNKIIPTLEEIKCCVASLTENVSVQEENISDMSNYTFTQAVANPLCELNHGISVINQMICEKALDFSENEIKVGLVTPLLELRNALEILQQDVISQNEENVNSLNIISSIANAVESVQSCIIMIQEQDFLENVDELSTLEDISAIKTFADILSSDHLLSPSVHEITTEINAQVPTKFETQIVNSVSVQILRDLNDHILILQRPEIVETLDELSKHDEYSSIQAIMTGINTIHCAIEDILHPVTLEESQELSYYVSPTQLTAIIQPVQELHEYLSVIDINNMLIEAIIKTDETKCLPQYLSKLEHCLRDSIDCLHVAIETADVTLEISTQIEKLRKLCVELKDNLATAKNYSIVDSSELIILDDSLTSVLATTNCNQEINIARVKFSLERLQQNIASMQDEILGFAVENPVVLHHETKILKSVADIENTIASLAVSQFVNISQISDFNFCDSHQVGKEVNNDQSKKIENIIETIENCIQQLPLDMPNNNNLMSVKDFVKIFNDEITLLSCLFHQTPTPKRIIKMLQLFYDLNENLKQYQLNQEMSGTSADFNVGYAKLEEGLQNIRVLLLEVLDTQKNLVFNIPISNITNVEIILNEILETNKNASLRHFVKLLMNTIESLKPCINNLHTDIVKELKSSDVILAVDDDTDKNFELLYKYLSENRENKEIEAELDFSEIVRVLQKHADYKHVKGTGKKLIYIKCISECLNVLKQTLINLESKKRVLNAESTSSSDYELNRLLIELSGPFEVFYKKIMNICNENLQITDKSNILEDSKLLELQEEAISVATVAEKILKCENLVISSDCSIKILGKDFVSKIHSIEKSLENLESAYAVQMIMNIQPIKEIEKIISTLLKEEVIREENRQSREKTGSLLQHMEQYIEIIEIVEEVSAVIKLDELKKSADIVRELRNSITSETDPVIHLTDSELNIREEQIHLVKNLQKALTTLQTDALDCEQELVPHISDDIRQHIIEVVSDLQNDLVALTNTPVVLEKSELSENVKSIDENYITLIKEEEEESIPSSLKENQNEQLIEETPLRVEVPSATNLEIVEEKQSLDLKSDIDLINSNIQDLSAMKFDQIRELLIHHINDYLCKEIIEDIKKLLPYQNFEQLEQSLGIAVEVRDNAVSEDSDPLAQQMFLKKQLELVVILQEVLLRIHSKNLYDVNDDLLLQPQIENKLLLTAKSVVQNLLNSLQMYVAQLNTIIQAEVLTDDSKIVSKQPCEEVVSNSTIDELKICDENFSIKEDQALAIFNKKQESVQEFRQDTDNYPTFEEDKHFDMLSEEMSNTGSVDNEHVNDKNNAPTFKVIFDEQKLDEKALKLELTEPGECYSSDMESCKSLHFVANSESITDMNIIDSINVQEETDNAPTFKVIFDEQKLDEKTLKLELTEPEESYSSDNVQEETEGKINDNDRLNEGNILLDSNEFNDTEIIEVIPANANADKEKSNAVLELDTLLQELNETLNLSENDPVIQDSDGLQDILEEVQTVILKLKCDFDGSTNDTLNENIEDLECNVRSVQLQINENCPPALLKEACANLQTLAACINNVCNTQSIFSKENNALRACTDGAKQALDLLDEVSFLKVDINLDNIILNLNSIKDAMKYLKSCFMNDAESLILKGIEVLRHLNDIEDKVFTLEKELEANNEIDVIFRDSIIAATHSIYGSISNMRGNLCSIQKKYMYDNYGKPTDNFLKSIKNVNVILSYDKKDDWKKFAKSLRTILKHFEDIKFYINFDKTARLPSDSAFTKIILSELRNMLSAVVLQNTKDLDMNLTGQIKDALNYVSVTLNNLENRTTLEVKEKIPIFKELSMQMHDITNKIKILLKKSIDTINEPLKVNEELSEQEENLGKIPLSNTEYDEKHAQEVEGLKKGQVDIEKSDIQITKSPDRSFDVKQNKNKINIDNQKEIEISTLESSIDSIVVLQNDNVMNEISQDQAQDIKNEHLNIDTADQEVEIKVPDTITTDTANFESDSITTTDEIQNIVEEITILDTPEKNILVRKEEETYFKTDIIEKENILDVNTMISGSSLSDIGMKHILGQEIEIEQQNTITTDTQNTESGSIKAADEIQNIVEGITICDSPNKNILVIKEEGTYYNTSIIEKENVLGVNTMISGSSLPDIGTSHENEISTIESSIDSTVALQHDNGINEISQDKTRDIENEHLNIDIEEKEIEIRQPDTITTDTGNTESVSIKAADEIQNIAEGITIFDSPVKNILVSKEEGTVYNASIIEKENVLDVNTMITSNSLPDIGMKHENEISTIELSIDSSVALQYDNGINEISQDKTRDIENEHLIINIVDQQIEIKQPDIITSDIISENIELGLIKAADEIQKIAKEITIFDSPDKSVLVSKDEETYNNTGIIENENVSDVNTMISGSSLPDINMKHKNETSTLDTSIDSTVALINHNEINEISQENTRDIKNEHLNIDITDQEIEIKLPDTITTDTGNIESSETMSANEIQSIVEEITTFDTPEKCVLVSKDEETYNNTGIIEKENVLDLNTMISGGSLPDIGMKHETDTMQESIEKETQKTNLKTENVIDEKIATVYPNQYENDNFTVEKQDEESEKNVQDVIRTEQDNILEYDNILFGIGTKNINNNNTSEESVKINTENEMKSVETNENKGQVAEDLSSSFLTKLQTEDLTLDEQKEESDNQLHIQIRKSSKINNEDIKCYKNIEEHSKIQCKDEISSNEIKANVATVTTKNEIETDIQIDRDITSETSNQVASQTNEKVEQTAVSSGEALTSSALNSVVTESLHKEKAKEEQSTTTAKQFTPEDYKSDIAVTLKQQNYDKIISLDSLQYTEQCYDDIKDIETKINDNTGKTEDIQQHKNQELDVDSKVESFKVEEDLSIGTITDTESKKIDGNFAESQEVFSSVFENVQSKTEFKDDPKIETSENNSNDIESSESTDPKIIEMKADDFQGNLHKVGAKELDIKDTKMSVGVVIEKANVLKTEQDINVVKDGLKSEVDITIVEYDKSTPLNTSEECTIDSQKAECSMIEKMRQSDIIIKLEEVPLSIYTPKMTEIAENIKTENESEIISYEQCVESHIKQSEPTEKKLEDGTQAIDNEIFLKDNEEQYYSKLQNTLMGIENITQEEKINKSKIITDVDGALLNKSMTEDTEKFSDLIEIQKDKVSTKIRESRNDEEQDIDVVNTSKEILNIHESVIIDEIVPESKESDITGSNQSQITKVIKKEKENENQLSIGYDTPRDTNFEEHSEDKESIQCTLTNNKEEDLHDKAKEKKSRTKDTVQEENESKQPVKKLVIQESFDIEKSTELISSIKIGDSTEVTLLGSQSESGNLKLEKENTCEEDFKDKQDNIAPNIKSESEKAEIEVMLPNTANKKEIDSNASNQTTDVNKENKDGILLIDKLESMNEEQGQTQEPLEKIEKVMPDTKDEKPKLKEKKSIKSKEKRHLKKLEEANSQSLEKSQKSKSRNDDNEFTEKKEEIEHQYGKDTITKEIRNIKNPVDSLGEYNKVEGDMNNEQKHSYQQIPEEIFVHEATKEKEASAGLKNCEKNDTEQNISEEILRDEPMKAMEAAYLRDNQQRKKIEEKKKDEQIEILHKRGKCTLDEEKIEKKNTDSNPDDQNLAGKENIDKSEKGLDVTHHIETGILNVEMKAQEYKPNEDEEIPIRYPNDSLQQQKIIDAGKNEKEIKLTNKEILSVNESNEFEILKRCESSSDKHISLIEEGTGLRKFQKTETDFTEFQVDEKHTLAKNHSVHDPSAYYSDELFGTVEDKIANNSDDIQQNNILCRQETKLNSQVKKHKEIKQRPLFIDHSEPDYAHEFARPPGYSTKSLNIDYLPMEIKTKSKSPTIYRAQTIIHESQLKSSLPPNIDQLSNISEGRTEHKQRSNTTSDLRSTISDKRGSYPRDFKRKPVFSTYLTDRTAVESSRVKLTCSVLSSTDPEISWYKNSVLLDNKHKCKIKSVDGLITLEILNAVPSDSGEYSCTVKNENGSITSTANLKVYPGFEASPIPPTFTRSIRDFYHLHENELVLECRIRGQPLPTITWLKDNRPIILNERYQAHYLADGDCRLTILSPNEDDSGKYTCKAENSMWSDQITHEVYFTSKGSRHMRNITTSENIRFTRQATESRRPHFTNVLSDHKVVSGGTIGLQVEICGSPTRVEWLREGRSVTETYSNAQTYIDRGLYTLALSDVTEKESGLYTCRAWSTQGPVEMNASITVVQPNQFDGKPATIISRPVKDLLISVGEDLNISFRVQGEPKPKVFFMKGIRDISNNQRVCKMTSDDYVKFTLKRSVISDAGTYCVFVRNAYGCDRAFVTVVIRQRASSDHLISDWTYPMDDLAISVVDRNYQSVPDRIPSEPSTVDGGNNWVSLAWPKPVSQVKAPILAYKVECWLLGKEGGARWVELGITPRNCFDAFNLKQGEEYHFRVTPRNRYGWGESVQTSTPIGIGLAGDRPEFIEILPGQLKVLVGETATLYCSFKGNPVPDIVWMKNGHEVEEEMERVIVQLSESNTSLQINDIQIEDEGRYSCEATNVHGRSSTYSRMAVITDRQIWAADAKLKRERSNGANGEYPPQFTMRLRDRRVQATYPVRLTCQVIGSPSPLVTWFKDGEEISVDSRRTTSKDEYFFTLEIAPTTLDDGGVYEAMARNGSGAISCRCNLVVDKGIRAYIAPEFCCGFEPLYRVCEGDELRISAVVEAYPSVGVTWYRDGVRLRPSRRAVMTLDRDGQIELALASVAPRDAGVYTCTASNEVGRASTSGKVEVLKGEQRSEIPKVPPIVVSPDLPYSKEPMFIKKPRSSEAREGDTVIIECEVTGDPKPEVYWLRDFLKPDYYRDASHFKRVGAGPAYRFEIPHAKFDYTGAYSIVAKNVHGEAKAIISLQILAKDSTCSDDTHNIRYGRVEVIPRFEKELTDLLCYDGDAIEFECRVSGNPEPDIRWFHYTEVLPECPDFESSYDLGTARLKIKHVTADDEGTYSCEASNNLGKATSSACLVIYPPGEPNTLSQRLRRPPALLSASSTPRSTPRTTPARSLSRTPGPDHRRLCSPSREIAPKFYTYPYNRVVEEGDTVVFQCAVKGLPPPWATWDKDGIIITPTARISIREKDDVFRMLEIEQVTIEDVGLYRVTLENDYGRAEASARLEVISQTGKFYGSRSYSVSPRKCLPYRRRTPSLTRQD